MIQELEIEQGRGAALELAMKVNECIRALNNLELVTSHTDSLKLPTSSEYVNMVQDAVQDKLTFRERGLLGIGYLIICRQLRAGESSSYT